MSRSIVLLCAVGILLAGCGGRRANPVSTVSVTDQYMSCTELQVSQVENDQRMAALREEERRAKSGNVAIGVVGALLFWPALFALDTTNTEQVEIDAYRNRNGYLTTLAAQRRCGTPEATQPAVREAGASPPVAAGARREAAGEFLRCQLDNGSIAMLTRRECTSWGGRII